VLLNHRVNGIALLHLQLLRGLVRLDAIAIVQEAHRIGGNAEARAVRVHQLSQRGGTLDLEEDLVAIGSLHLQVQVDFLGLFRHGFEIKSLKRGSRKTLQFSQILHEIYGL